MMRCNMTFFEKYCTIILFKLKKMSNFEFVRRSWHSLAITYINVLVNNLTP